jgi:hypothetical protein
MNTIIFREPVLVGKKKIGDIHGRIFKKVIHGSKHLLRIPPAIAIDKEAFVNINNSGVVVIQVLDVDTQVLYSISTTDFIEYHKPLDRGYGEQYYVELKYWSKGIINEI